MKKPSLVPKLIAVSITVCMLFKINAQTAFTGPSIVTQTGAAASYNSTVVTPESVNGTCTEVGQTWTHSFNGTSNRKLSGFTISSISYYVNNFGSLSTTIRRNNASGGNNLLGCAPTTPPWNDRQIVFFEGTSNFTTNVTQIVNSFPDLSLPGSPGYNTLNEMNKVFSRGFINSGADNIFNNMEGSGAGFNSNSNNIERMDLFVSGGVTVTAANINKTGIVVVCRGPADDPVVLSAIKSLSGGTNIGGGTDYVYDDIIKINSTWTSKTINGGSGITIPVTARVTLLSNINSVILRRMDSDATLNDQLNITDSLSISSVVAAQNIVGMFFTFADLGLVAGETFYGYSVSGFDVTAVNSTQFNSYLNSTYFPLNTSPANGGVDLTGFPGLFTPVDIDDDDDGLPDYLEANLPLAFGDHDTDGILNYSDANYPGYLDLNSDGVNDNFDPSADSDNDTSPNYRDSGFPGFVDTNSDGVNDNFDWDMDGISNHLDRDSDNDGIPDVTESFGVDANGDGIIDNYSDTDVDGLSQNADLNSTGAANSGLGLGALDTDADGIPNYFDFDSDNDGIPDVVEAFGTDSNNNGIVDSYTDTDLDGFSDNVDGDVGNDNLAENTASLLRTGADGNNDGKADSYPYKNMETDSKPNPYDLDSDGDGITDVKEAQFTDANNDGRIDGAVNSKGWNTGIAALGSLSLPNTDAVGRANLYDIDSDEDGIPDNVEGISTFSYSLPAAVDTDLDGIDNSYDNFSGFGGNGINPFDKDGDTVPDYLDSDTDNDGLNDRVEGNDLNFNGIPDDNVTLTGTDTDGDGLDDRFDNNNGNVEGTSAYMGNGGTTSGDPTPGSITTVQHTAIAASQGCPLERDWRCMWYVLNCEIIDFKVNLQNNKAFLDWKAICRQEVERFIIERSFNGTIFRDITTINGRQVANGIESYSTIDDLSSIYEPVIYYRLRTELSNGRVAYSPILPIRFNQDQDLIVFPNPVRDQLNISINSAKNENIMISLLDGNGRSLFSKSVRLKQGANTFTFNEISDLPSGLYYLSLQISDMIISRKINILK